MKLHNHSIGITKWNDLFLTFYVINKQFGGLVYLQVHINHGANAEPKGKTKHKNTLNKNENNF